MFSLVQWNPHALSDHMILQTVVKDVFSTFCRHYVSNLATLADGGRFFQPIGATLPFGLPPIINSSNVFRNSSYQDTDVRTSTNKTVEAIVHTPVNELVMSSTAVILCFAILASLACVAVLVYFPYAAYFKGLPTDVDTLASIIALVYDSFQCSQPSANPKIGQSTYLPLFFEPTVRHRRALVWVIKLALFGSPPPEALFSMSLVYFRRFIHAFHSEYASSHLNDTKASTLRDNCCRR